MAADAILDLAALLAPIPGDDPAGEPVPFAIKNDLDEARKEVDPSMYAEDDPSRPAEAVPARWGHVIRVGSRCLIESSKDLLVALMVTEAMTKEHGFAGLAESLEILRGLVEQCWDRFYPKIDPNDPDSLEDRTGKFQWLSSADRGARFPSTIRSTPLVRLGNRGFGWLHWKSSTEGKGGVTREDWDKAVAATTPAFAQATADALTRCLSEFTALSKALDAAMGSSSPGLSELRSALGESYTLAQQILKLKGPAGGGEAEASDGGETAGGSSGGSGGGDGPGRAIASRADAYRRLQEAADVLERIEPHSPIPYLVRRAVELGALPFPLLMRALIRDDSVLSDMNRELGIKPPPGE